MRSFRKAIGIMLIILTGVSLHQCRHKPVDPKDPGTVDCELEGPSINLDSVTNVYCGADSGAIYVSGSGGSGPYSFSMDNTNFQKSGIFANLSPGLYTITVEDSTTGCTKSLEVEVQSFSDIQISLTSDNATCGNSDGTIYASASGGKGNFQFSIDGTTYSSDSIFSNLSVGTYTVYAKDSSGCIETMSTNVNDNGNVNFLVNLVNADCGTNNGSITFHSMTGIAPFQFSIDNGASFQSDSTFTNLSGGIYNLVLQDSSGCSKSLQATIDENPGDLDFTSSTTNSGCGTNNGSITVNASGGTGSNYKYNINGGSYGSNNVFSSLATGIYTIGLRDSIGCEITKDVQVSSGISYSGEVAAIISSSCGLSNCHDGSNGGLPDLTNYSVAKTYASSMKSKLLSGQMPKSPGTITDENKEKIICWIDDGALNN